MTVTLAAFVLLGMFQSVHADPLAFPGADGFARNVTGGRGGTVYHVTNLNDSGPGSFREGVKERHRTVVFDLGGYIQLKSALSVESDMTIAGQTAAGEGIATLGYEVSFSKSKNIIVRYMRFRQGNTESQRRKSAVGLYEASNVILDHVSIEWGRWDCVDMNKCSNITLEYCIIGQGVGPQRFGCLCEGDNITFTHNLWIDNQSRNPKAKGTVQYVNNVVYNWGGAAGFVGGHSAADSYDDLVNNYFIAGPSSAPNKAFSEGTLTDKVYSSGNYVDTTASGTLAGIPMRDEDLGHITLQKEPFSKLDLKIDTAQEALKKVIAGAGCSLRRDSVDHALIDQVKSFGKEGKVIEDINEIGGPGDIHGGPPSKEVLELKESGTINSDGYTNLEAYLNGLVH